MSVFVKISGLIIPSSTQASPSLWPQLFDVCSNMLHLRFMRSIYFGRVGFQVQNLLPLNLKPRWFPKQTRKQHICDLLTTCTSHKLGLVATCWTFQLFSHPSRSKVDVFILLSENFATKSRDPWDATCRVVVWSWQVRFHFANKTHVYEVNYLSLLANTANIIHFNFLTACIDYHWSAWRHSEFSHAFVVVFEVFSRMLVLQVSNCTTFTTNSKWGHWNTATWQFLWWWVFFADLPMLNFPEQLPGSCPSVEVKFSRCFWILSPSVPL